MARLISAGGRTDLRLGRPNVNTDVGDIPGLPNDVVFFQGSTTMTIYYTKSGRWFGSGRNLAVVLQPHVQGNPDFQLYELCALASITPLWFSCGDTCLGIVSQLNQLFFISPNNRDPTMQPILPSIDFRYCSAGNEVVVAIPAGQSGLYLVTSDTSIAFLSSDCRFLDCAAGRGHIVAISCDGRVFLSLMTGGAFFEVPCGSKPARSCYAYDDVALVVGVDDGIWVRGKNAHGALGTGVVDAEVEPFTSVRKFTNDGIRQVCFARASTVFLTDGGEVFVAGSNGNGRLFEQEHGDITQFRVPNGLRGMKISCIAAGREHVIVGVNMPQVLQHPTPHPIRRRTPAHYVARLGNGSVVDVSMQRLAAAGVELGKVVEVGKRQGRVIGFKGEDLLIETAARNMIVANKLWFQSTKDATEVYKGRSGATYSLVTIDSALQFFGFLNGEAVRHELAGAGAVAGAYGGSLWIVWDSDNGAVTQATTSDLLRLHDLVEIVEPRGRRCERLALGQNVLNCEVYPCQILSAYGLQVRDLVTNGEKIYEILGTFSCYAIVRNVLTGETEMTLPISVSLRRRHGVDPVFVKLRAINRTLVDANVSCDGSDELWPFDRIITVKGLATVYGRDRSGRIWIQTDDALVLNLGVCLLSGKWSLLRRLGPEFEPVDAFRMIPGDIVRHGNRDFVVASDSSLWDVQTGVSETVADEAEPEIVSRALFPSGRKYGGHVFRTDVEAFRGFGVKAGDAIEITAKEGMQTGTVIGIASHELWVHFEGDEGPACLEFPYRIREAGKVVRRLTVAFQGRDP
jgi:hypothetical protein